MSHYDGYSIEYHPKFKKEFNKILNKNKCPTLKQDFKLLLKTLVLNLNESQRFPEHVCMHIAGLDSNVTKPAFIVKKFRCKNINKGANSGFRITFIFDRQNKKFIFIEFFNKNKKEVEDKNRINRLFRFNIDVEDELFNGEEEFLNSD